MWLIIECPAGQEVERRPLGPDEVMDARAFANEYAERFGCTLTSGDGYIPNCCGDIRVEFRYEPDNHVKLWHGESFYWESGYD